MRELVLVHGRSQEHKDSVALKKEWLDTLRLGLEKSGLELPIPETSVRFPYYGQTLYDLVAGVGREEAAQVIVRGNEADTQLRDFVMGILTEILAEKGVTDNQVLAEAEAALEARGGSAGFVERGPLNWGWVQGILSAIDRYVPGGSGASIALFTRDVFQYLQNAGLRGVIDDGVQQALTAGGESIVVSHSLGTVVAYNLLRRKGTELGWKVPLFVTLGSPLAIGKIRKSLSPIRFPQCAGAWFNAMDPDDVVALYPLDEHHFPVEPPIENKTDVKNQTENQHGIVGYLNDQEIAKRIYDALVA
jgi:hypothetical protein